MTDTKAIAVLNAAATLLMTSVGMIAALVLSALVFFKLRR